MGRHTLPRTERVPVSVHIRGGVQTSDSSKLPRVDRLKLELAWRGVLSTGGLPICSHRALVGRESRQAIEACGPALVGSGRLQARIFLPNQDPFGVEAKLNAFNARTEVGRRAVLVHAYSADPPAAFVIPFVVRQAGSSRTVLTTTIRRAVGRWPHVANFRIDVSRRFSYRGQRRSFLNASCPIPPNFTAGFLSFARATYFFADGRRLKVESVRSRHPERSSARPPAHYSLRASGAANGDDCVA
jgi:hypothetical protein